MPAATRSDCNQTASAGSCPRPLTEKQALQLFKNFTERDSDSELPAEEAENSSSNTDLEFVNSSSATQVLKKREFTLGQLDRCTLIVGTIYLNGRVIPTSAKLTVYNTLSQDPFLSLSILPLIVIFSPCKMLLITVHR